jgi:glycosyltransferase involved in cell wall biosynthesis
MSSPRFAVVIPAYNSASFIHETLESLSAQTYRDFETILVDDRSTDATGDIARDTMAALGLKGTVLVREPHQPKGVSTCRNLGLQAAQGEWVAFLDSDDLFAPQKLERMALAVERSAGAARAIYHPSRRFDDASGQTLGIVTLPGEPWSARRLLDEVLVGNFHATCGMVIERALLREIGGFHSGLYGVEDWWLAIQVSARTSWLFVDETLAHIRVRSASLMTNAPFEHYVRQHLALVRVARASGELSRRNVDVLHDYCLGPLTRYFAGLAFSRGGWGALGRGVLMLIVAGELRAALAVVYGHARLRTLTHASRTARLLRPTSARR